MKVLITICARGGSKGIKDKNIKPLLGKPLIYYTLKHGRIFSEHIDSDIIISSDSEKILNTVASMGFKTNYKRPDELGKDNVGKVAVIRHAWQFAESYYNTNYDYVLDLDVTSPIRRNIDLIEALKKINKHNEALNLFSVSPASKNPYFNMVEEDGNGFVKLVKNVKKIKARQSAPKVYDMNASFYFFTREFMEGEYEITTTNKSVIYTLPYKCFDIDDPIDFKIMEFLLNEKLLGFEI